MASAEGAIDAYLGFEIERDLLAGTLTLSQKHYAEGILRTYDAWECFPSPTVLPPGQRLVKKLHRIVLSTYATQASLAVGAIS